MFESGLPSGHNFVGTVQPMMQHMVLINAVHHLPSDFMDMQMPKHPHTI